MTEPHKTKTAPVEFVTVAELKAAIGSDVWTPDELTGLTAVTGAVNAYLGRVRADVTVPDADVKLGAVMLAQGWLDIGGRGSAAGFAELGYTPSTVTRDVARLCGIDAYYKVAIG